MAKFSIVFQYVALEVSGQRYTVKSDLLSFAKGVSMVNNFTAHRLQLELGGA